MAHSAAMAPMTIIVMLRASGGRSGSPPPPPSGGRTSARPLPTTIAAPNASTSSGSRSSPSSIAHLRGVTRELGHDRRHLGRHRLADHQDARAEDEEPAGDHRPRRALVEQHPA